MFKTFIQPYILLCVGILILNLPTKIFAQTATEDNLLKLAIYGSVLTTIYSSIWGKNPLNESLNLKKQLGAGFQYGSDKTVNMRQIQLVLPYKNALYNAKKWDLTGHWELDVATWNSKLSNPINKSGYFFGITPVFNYTWRTNPIQPYVEVGIGIKYLSSVIIENSYKSTQFQFGDIFGIGIGNDKYQLGYRFLHISNSNIKNPNPGTNFNTLHFSYNF